MSRRIIKSGSKHSPNNDTISIRIGVHKFIHSPVEIQKEIEL